MDGGGGLNGGWDGLMDGGGVEWGMRWINGWGGRG